MESRHWSAVIYSALAVAWAALVVATVPMAVCDWLLPPVSADLARPRPEPESKRLAGAYCGRIGATMRSAVAVAVAPAVVLNAVSAALLAAARRRASKGSRPGGAAAPAPPRNS